MRLDAVQLGEGAPQGVEALGADPVVVGEQNPHPRPILGTGRLDRRARRAAQPTRTRRLRPRTLGGQLRGPTRRGRSRRRRAPETPPPSPAQRSRRRPPRAPRFRLTSPNSWTPALDAPGRLATFAVGVLASCRRRDEARAQDRPEALRGRHEDAERLRPWRSRPLLGGGVHGRLRRTGRSRPGCARRSDRRSQAAPPSRPWRTPRRCDLQAAAARARRASDRDDDRGGDRPPQLRRGPRDRRLRKHRGRSAWRPS